MRMRLRWEREREREREMRFKADAVDACSTDVLWPAFFGGFLISRGLLRFLRMAVDEQGKRYAGGLLHQRGEEYGYGGLL